MRIATWNVNSIKQRVQRLLPWLDERRPDVVCLQEIKASPDQLPVWLCDLEGYWCYWHGEKGYSGVGLHVSKAVSPERPDFTHPAFDYENRMIQVRLPALTVISVYVPNGGKDFEAKMRFLGELEAYAAAFQAASTPAIICGEDSEA